jgi:hypothetical protein
MLHLVDERLKLLLRFGAVLHGGTNLVEEVQALLDFPLSISGVWTLLRSGGSAGYVGVAGVEVAEYGGIAITTVAGHPVADLAAAVSVALIILAATTVAAALLATLPGLAALLTLTLLLATLTLLATLLARLAVTSELPGLSRLALALALLSLLTLLALPACLTLLPIASAKFGKLIAQAREVIHCTVERGVLRRPLLPAA